MIAKLPSSLLIRKIQRVPFKLRLLTLDPRTLSILHLMLLAWGLRTLFAAGGQLLVRIPVSGWVNTTSRLIAFARG